MSVRRKRQLLASLLALAVLLSLSYPGPAADSLRSQIPGLANGRAALAAGVEPRPAVQPDLARPGQMGDHFLLPLGPQWANTTAPAELDLDTTAPTATISYPLTGAHNLTGTISVAGTVDDHDLQLWSLEYGAGATPDTWSTLAYGTNRKHEETLGTWSVGTLGPAGLWTLRLVVTDTAGLTSEARASLTRDFVPPTSQISAPVAGAAITTTSFSVAGTAADDATPGVTRVEVWDSDSREWRTASDTESWSIPFTATTLCQTYHLRSRAVDASGNVETPGPGITLTVAPAVQLEPDYPPAHTAPSAVMQGGTLHRYLQAVDQQGTPLPAGVVITYTTGRYTRTLSTAAGGALEFVIPTADSITQTTDTPLTGSLTRTVSLLVARAGACPLEPAGALPEFSVRVEPRAVQHTWDGGLAPSLLGEVSVLDAGQWSGGTRVGVDYLENVEIEPRRDAGVALDPSFDLGVAEAGAAWQPLPLAPGGRELVTSQVRCTGPDEACQARRRANAAALIASLARTAGAADNPAVQQIVGALSAPAADGSVPRPADSADPPPPASAAAGAAVGFPSGNAAGAALAFNLTDTSVDLAYLLMLNQYPESAHWGVTVEQEILTGLKRLSLELGGNRVARASDYFGLAGANDRFRLVEELIFDAAAQPVALRISLSDGIDTITYRIQGQEQITYLLDVPNVRALSQVGAEQPLGGLQLGFGGVATELSALVPHLESLSSTYEKSSATPVSRLGFELGLDFGAQTITLGTERPVVCAERRSDVQEVGVVAGGQRRVLAEYEHDSLVTRDTHTLNSLLDGVLDGLWEYVAASVAWEQQLVGDEGWAIDVAAGASPEPAANGAEAPGWARLEGGTGALADARVAFMSWAPTQTLVSGLTVVGAEHLTQVDPASLVPSQPLTLTVGYNPALAAAQGITAGRLGLYYWEPAGGRWSVQPTVAFDSISDSLRLTTTQFGLWAVGADVTPPTITPVEPHPGGQVTPTAPVVVAVSDAVSGVAAASVTLWVDGAIVPHRFVSVTGRIDWQPERPLAPGQHSAKVEARDGDGNLATRQWAFLADNGRPTAAISAPAPGLTLRGQITVTGAAHEVVNDHDQLAFYRLELLPAAGPERWWVGRPVTHSVADGVLGGFDSSTLRDGAYLLKLTAQDRAGNQDSAQVKVILANGDVPPVVQAHYPITNATGVATVVVLTATFSQEMDASSLSATTFGLRDGKNAAIPGQVDYDAATRTATFTPLAPLAPNAVHTAAITSGAASVRGVPLVVLRTWNFTTGP